MTPYKETIGDSTPNRWDAIFSALQTEPRRQLILSLTQSEIAPLPMSAMGSKLQLTHDELTIELIHRHLPHLENREFITWTKEPFLAKRGNRFDELDFIVRSIMKNAEFLPDSLQVPCMDATLSQQTGSAD